MNTKEFIRRLNEIDPDGVCEIYGGDGDIYDLIRLPWYYDGRPGKIIWEAPKTSHVEDFNIKGLKQHTQEDGDKIYIYCYGLDDAASDEIHCGEPREIIGDERFVKTFEDYKERMLSLLNNRSEAESKICDQSSE